MLKLAQGLAGVLRIGFGHGWILAHDVHPANAAGVDVVDDLDDGEAPLGIERAAPQPLVLRALQDLIAP